MSDITTEFDRSPIPIILGARNILALDLGTHCGYALSSDRIVKAYGAKNFTPKRTDGPGQRWLKFRAMLGDLYNVAGELHAVYFEDVKRHGITGNNVIAAHVYGGFLAHLEAWCDVQRVGLIGVGVGTVKKAWTGFGNCNKESMIVEARRRGFKVAADDDDTSDALAVLHLAIKMETSHG